MTFRPFHRPLRLLGFGVALLLAAVSPLPGALGAEGLRDQLGPAFPAEKVAEAESLLGGLSLPAPEMGKVREGALLLARGAFPPSAVTDFLALCARLNAAGISPSDLVSKVQEGTAKRVESHRVTAVLEDRTGRLLQGRVLVLDLATAGVVFLDQQMAYRVVADYLARGISPVELRDRALRRDLADFPALDNVIR